MLALPTAVSEGHVSRVRAIERAAFIFQQSNGEVTRRYYAQLGALGADGRIAVALFRAQKTSTRAKLYRGRRYKSASYDVKNWSLGELCRELMLTRRFPFGWGQDDSQEWNPHVLYVDLPQGQVSFHSPTRLDGPDYEGEWDGARLSCERILMFCDSVADSANAENPQPTPNVQESANA